MKYKLGKLLGFGSDGKVFELIGETEKLAVKYIQSDKRGITNYLEYFIIFNLDERYVTKCKFIEKDEEDGLIKIVFPLAKSNLKTYIKEKDLTNLEKKNLMFKIAKSLKYLHSLKIIHGDIKLTNILIFENEEVKLTDFNLSTIELKNFKAKRKFYTITYRPREVENGFISTKSDIFALGCAFFEIFYGYPYMNLQKGEKFYHLKNHAENLEENQIFNNLIEKMLQESMDSRIGIDLVLKDRFFIELTPYKKIKPEKKILDENELLKKFQVLDQKSQKIFLKKLQGIWAGKSTKNYNTIERDLIDKKFDFL